MDDVVRVDAPGGAARIHHQLRFWRKRVWPSMFLRELGPYITLQSGAFKIADDLTDSELNGLTGIHFANSLEQAMEYTSGRKSVRMPVMPLAGAAV